MQQRGEQTREKGWGVGEGEGDVGEGEGGGGGGNEGNSMTQEYVKNATLFLLSSYPFLQDDFLCIIFSITSLLFLLKVVVLPILASREAFLSTQGGRRPL
jgi:hypothetical protein